MHAFGTSRAHKRSMLLRLLPIALVGHASAAMAINCNVTRGSAGAEVVAHQVGANQWHPGGVPFRDNVVGNVYATAGGRCDLSEQFKAVADGTVQYATASHEPGVLEGPRNKGVAIANNAYLSYTPIEGVFIDVGKIRKSNGYLFGVNPLDLLRNTTGNPRVAKVNVLGPHWRDQYDEGSVGAAMTVFSDQGTFDLAAFPRLVSKRELQSSAADWSALERTNSSNRFYASFTASGMETLNPTVSLVTGDYDAIAFGISKNLSDNLILNAEGSVALGERWRHLDMTSANAIRHYQTVADPFRRDNERLNAEAGIGLRYTDQRRIEYGIEYYGQSQGYSRGEWNGYFDTVSFVNGGYAMGLPSSFFSPVQVKGYQNYASMIAAQYDNTGRSGNLQGKHYATAYISSKKETQGEMDWIASTVVNVVDGSGMFNLHLSTFLTDSTEAYAGGSYSAGPPRSEFGQFGKKGSVYAGMRLRW